jgi:exopolysaccharide production protein ExoY
MEDLMTRGSAERVYASSTAILETEIGDPNDGFEEFESCSYSSDPVLSWPYYLAKRAVDFLLSTFLIVLFAFPGVLIAAIIRCTSEGPVFYREDRIGRNGRVFRIWKFRSMYQNATAPVRVNGNLISSTEWRMRKRDSDPRITPVGRFLRRWSFDEVPQLLNVFRGEMSLIGPRPIVAAEMSLYGDLARYYLAATPGLSGLWQVSGRSEIGYAQRAHLDALYVSTWSPQLDWTIFVRTVPAVLSRRGAY